MMNPLLEKIAIALFVGSLGVLTGVIAWWFLTPALDIPLVVFKLTSFSLGALFFGYGLFKPDSAIEILGAIWKFLWRLSSEVLRYINLFRR